MFQEEAVSLFASVNSWLTPTVLFLLLNLMIGTIALTSGFSSSPPRPNPHHQPPLTPSPSILHRLTSINFYNYYSTPPQPPPSPEQPQPEPEPEPEPIKDAEPEDDEEGPTMEEIYHRIKHGGSNPQYCRRNSDTNPCGGDIPERLPRKMRKSASENSAFSHFQEAEPPADERDNAVAPAVEGAGGTIGDEGVDAKADDFINRFKQQLKLQKNESSILQYKDMISKASA